MFRYGSVQSQANLNPLSKPELKVRENHYSEFVLQNATKYNVCVCILAKTNLRKSYKNLDLNLYAESLFFFLKKKVFTLDSVDRIRVFELIHFLSKVRCVGFFNIHQLSYNISIIKISIY